jgi:Rrf2 family transcriptional regulator, cysteine metabolism repressor
MMKFSTRSRYGLRMMIEIARELEKENLVQLKRIAKITALSKNYLEQLAMPLKKKGILKGIPGKMGGYQLAKPVEQIRVSDIVVAVDGPIGITDCVNHPEVCMNSSFCESRSIWTILSGSMIEILNKFTLKDLIDRKRYSAIKKDYNHLYLLDSDQVVKGKLSGDFKACAIKN